MFRKIKIKLYLKTECCGNIFSPANTFIIFVSTDYSLVIIKSCCLNLNLDLSSIAAGILQSIVIVKAPSSRMYIPVKSAIIFFPNLLYFLIPFL